MADDWRRQSGLVALNIAARVGEGTAESGVRLCERPFRGQVAVRGESDDATFLAAFREGMGFDLPLTPNTTASHGEVTALWLGPSEWLIVTPGDGPGMASALRQSLSNSHHAVTNVSESRAVIGLGGRHARDVLAKGCSLDLHPTVFAPPQCAQSNLARTHMLLHALADDPETGPTCDIYVHRSFAEYAWRWLEDASLEYGVSVVADV